MEDEEGFLSASHVWSLLCCALAILPLVNSHPASPRPNERAGGASGGGTAPERLLASAGEWQPSAALAVDAGQVVAGKGKPGLN